jgi:hypothetical protein
LYLFLAPNAEFIRALFTIMPFAGPALGPVVAGYMSLAGELDRVKIDLILIEDAS